MDNDTIVSFTYPAFRDELGDLVREGVAIERPGHVWSADIERHEALLNLVVVKYHHHRPVAAGRMKLRAA